MWLTVSVWVGLASTLLGANAESTKCSAHLAIADYNHDSVLNETEYVHAVNSLSHDAFKDISTFEQLPDVIRQVFERLSCPCFHNDPTCCEGKPKGLDMSGVFPQLRPTSKQRDHIDQICEDMSGAISRALQRTSRRSALFVVPSPTVVPRTRQAGTPSPTTSFTVCYDDMATSDQNGDDYLSQKEYIQFVNLLSDNYFNVSTFGQLPTVVRSNFFKLQSDNGQIDINGTMSGQTPTADQQAHLNTVCKNTTSAILSAQSTPVPTATPAPGTTPTPVPTVTTAPATSPTASATPATTPTGPTASPVSSNSSCFNAMNVADANDDDYITQPEYIVFVNELSNDAFNVSTFGQLPKSLRQNFFQLAEPMNSTSQEALNVYGSRAGQTPNATQQQNLDLICSQTNERIDAVLAPSASPTASPVPSGAPSSTPETDAPSPTPSLVEPSPSPSSVGTTTGAPSPSPSQGGDSPSQSPTIVSTVSPAPSQGEFSPPPTQMPSALGSSNSPTFRPSALQPTISPSLVGTTKSPSPAAPSASATPTAPGQNGVVEILSTFVISNTDGLNAVALDPGTFVDNLEEAYSNVAESVVSSLNPETRRRGLRVRNSEREWRRRKLEVTFMNGTINTIVDVLPCPEGVPENSLCQTVTGSFNVSIINEDPVGVNQQYTAAMNSAINAGELQAELIIVNPQTPIKVVQDPVFPPTQSPVDQPADSSDDGALNAGIISGIVAVGAVAVGGAAFWYMSRGKSGGNRRKPLNQGTDDMQTGFGEGGDFNDSNSSFVSPSAPAENYYAKVEVAEENPNRRPSQPLSDSDASNNRRQSIQEKNNVNRYGEEGNDESSDDASDDHHHGTNPGSLGESGSLIDNYTFDEPVLAPSALQAKAQQRVSQSDSSPGSSGWDDESSDSESDSDSDSSSGSSYETESEAESGNTSFLNDHNPTAASRDQFFNDPNFDNSAAVAAAAAVESSDAAQEESEESDSESESDSEYTDDDSEETESEPSTPNTPEETGDNQAPAIPANEAGGQGPMLIPLPIPVGRSHDDEDEDHDESDDGSASYTSSDSTYDERTLGTLDDENTVEDNYVRPDVQSASRGFEEASLAAQSAGRKSIDGDLEGDMSEDLKHRDSELEKLVEQRDWDGIIASAGKFEAEADGTDTRSGYESSEGDSESTSGESGSDDDDSSSSGDSSTSSGSDEASEGKSIEASNATGYESTVDGTSETETAEEAQRRIEYRAEVEALIRMVVPEEVDNVDVMMEQFRGREPELITTLRTMQERSVTQRARAAVHKSKLRPPRRDQSVNQYRRDGTYSVDSRQTDRSDSTRGSAAGSAAIAAASIPRPATGRVPIHPPPVPKHEMKILESEESSPSSDAAPNMLPTNGAGAPTSEQSRERPTILGGRVVQASVTESEGSSTSETEDDYVPKRKQANSSSGSSTSSSGSSFNGTSGSESTDSNDKSAQSKSAYSGSGSLEDLPTRWNDSRNPAPRPPARLDNMMAKNPRVDAAKRKPWQGNDENLDDSGSDIDFVPSVSLGGVSYNT